jgi:hypothetical protein
MPLVYEREMTITHKDFLRLLPKAIAGLSYQKAGNQIEILDNGRSIKISLSNESIRKIASLCLPVTNVRIELNDFQTEDSIGFISRFDLAYQKGGG